MNAFGVVDEFERRVAEFAGSKYAVAVDCCTHAIFLCLKWLESQRDAGGNKVWATEAHCPARTYVSVPAAIVHAGWSLVLTGEAWTGTYRLAPTPIVDGAKRFHRAMYEGGLHCLSFHSKKILNIGRGGMVLTDDEAAVRWLRAARYDGREGKPYPQEHVRTLGWHMYMTPEQAARGLQLLDVLPENMPDQLEDYPDLRTMPAFYYTRKQ